jgi:tetratricopeptide (TPR) repeat protein
MLLEACSFLGCFLLCVSLYAQGASEIEKELGVLAEKLADEKSPDREEALRHAASLSNQLGEERFARGAYEDATKAFLAADEYLRQYNTIVYQRSLKDLEQAEKRLEGFEKEQDPARREVLVKIGLTVVWAALSQVFTYARELGDEAAQVKALERSLAIAIRTGDLSDQADALENLGQLDLNAGRNEQAFGRFNRALELRTKAGRKEYRSIDHLAGARVFVGEYDKALELYQEEIELLEELVSKQKSLDTLNDVQRQTAAIDHSVLQTSLIQALLNRAYLHQLMGKFGDAGDAVERASAVLVQMLEHEQRSQADVRSILKAARASAEALIERNKGRIAEGKGDSEGAAAHYTRSLDIFSSLSGGSPSGAVAGLRARLAAISAKKNKFDEARAHIREAARIRARLHQEGALAYALMQSSRVELLAGQIDAAAKIARQAKAVALNLNFQDLIAEAGEIEADVFVVRATAPQDLALEQAIVGYKAAVETYKRFGFLPSHLRASLSLGTALEKAGRIKDAEAAYKQAVVAAEAIRTSFRQASDSESFASRADVLQLYQKLVELLARSGRAEEALQFATRAQRKVIADKITTADIKLTGAAAAALQSAKKAEMKIAAAQTNAENTRGTDAPTGGGTTQRLANAIGHARQEYALSIKRLEVEEPNLKFTVRPTDLLKLQSTAAPDEAIVSYLVTPERLHIFVVSKTSVAVRSVGVSQAELRLQVASAREAFKSFSQDFYDLSSDPDTGFATERTRADLRNDDGSEHYAKVLAPAARSLRRLDKYLIEPIADLLSTTGRLRIIPNSELFLLPFGALVSERSGKYLIERFETTFATAGDLIAGGKTAGQGQLFAFGNPTEANLDGALEEVKAIQRVFPRSQVFVDAQATKERLFRTTSAKILHFATHGHIRSPLESSSIQLARLPNLKDPDLTYGEIFALPLDGTEMVVLSACETALGSTSGTEVGVFIEAFRTKTNTVAASLWSVDDVATRELMVEFYRGLSAGQSRAASMRAAQLKLLRDGRTKHPLFWAAFVLYGDGGPITAARPAQRARRG